MTDASDTTDNPFFARLWTFLSSHETEEIQRLRTENLAGLSGRVLEVGAGTGTNFAFYPATVTEVVAVEPERRLAPLARAAAEKATVPVTVTAGTVEKFLGDSDGSRSTRSCARWCSARSMIRTVFCDNCFRCCGPAASCGFSSMSPAGGFRGRLQKFADATVWPRLMGNCHTHRDTEASIVGAGFAVEGAVASRRCLHGFRRRWPSTPSAAHRAVA